MKLRQWTPEDTSELVGWLEEDPEYAEKMVFPPDKSAVGVINAITAIMFSGDGVILAAESGGQLIGYVIGTSISPDGSAVVHGGAAPKHQSKGGLIMKAGVNKAFNGMGLTKLITVVPNDRPEVLKLDRAIGFKDPPVKILILDKEA